MPITSHLAVKFLSIEVKGGVAYYTISVTDLATKETWIFQSRYSRMREVHDSLNGIAKDSVPIFPPKRCCFNTEAAFVSQRQKALENYFNIVLKNAQLAELVPLRHFLYGEKEAFSHKSSKEGKKALGFLKGTNFEERESSSNVYLGPKKSLGLKNAVDSFAFRFIDLAMTITPPEEEDVQKKKSLVMAHRWPKISSLFFDENQMPKGNEQNLIFVKEESYFKRNEEQVYEVEKTMRKIMELAMESKEFLHPSVLVYEIQ